MKNDYSKFNHTLSHHGLLGTRFKTKDDAQKYIDNCPFKLEEYKIINSSQLNCPYQIYLDYDKNESEQKAWRNMQPKK